MTTADDRATPVPPPRLSIRFPVGPGTPALQRQLPFAVAVLADLSGDGASEKRLPLGQSSLIEVEQGNFSDVMRNLAPRLRLRGTKIPDGGAAELRFETLEDFHPHRIAEQIPSVQPELRLRGAFSHLCHMLVEAPDLNNALAEAIRDATRRSAVVEAADGLDGADAAIVEDLVALMGSHACAVPREEALPAIRHLFSFAQTHTQSAVAELERLIRALDQQLTAAIAAVVHHPRFCALKATWRGLWFLVSRSAHDAGRRVWVLDATREQVSADLNAGSALFNRFCQVPFELDGNGGAPREDPASLLLVDWSWGANVDDLQTLNALARLAADCHSVVLTNAAASLVGLEGWDSLRADTELRVEPAGAAGEAWRGLRDLEASRHLALVMPPVAARDPYGRGGPDAAGFAFEEEDGASPQMNAAWVLAARLMLEDERSGWFNGFCSYRPDGWSPGLARARREGANPYSRMTDRQELAAYHAGLLPLSISEAGDPFFAVAAMVHKPRRYDRPEASHNAAIAARLPFVLGTARFMQALRLMTCEAIRWTDDEGLAERTRNWLHLYVWNPGADNGDGVSGDKNRIPKPLHSARLELRPLPDGRTGAVCYLRPWLGREELSTEMRLIVRLPRQPIERGSASRIPV